MSSHAIDLFKKRRTQYALGTQVTQSKDELTALIQDAIRHAPTAFNSQPTRAVILYGEHSRKLWKLTEDVLRKIAPAEGFERTEQKLASFAAGVGTVLFFTDDSVTKHLQETYPLYAKEFPYFAEHAMGMAQYAVWTTLAEAGVGASLQHYNPVIDADVHKEWNIPQTWTLRAEMPFGSNEAPFPEKTFIEDEARFRVFG